MKKILFVCVENAGRSQIAEASAKHYGDGKIEALSAGTMPSSEVNPIVVEVMEEDGNRHFQEQAKANHHTDGSRSRHHSRHGMQCSRILSSAVTGQSDRLEH